MTINQTPTYAPGTKIEIIHALPDQRRLRHVLFDFDGTLSLIREGWQDIMNPMMLEFLTETGARESEEELTLIIKEFVARLTGKQTIYQMIELKEQIEKRGGTAKDPLEYKYIYLDRLWERIKHRVEGLRNGKSQPVDFLVPGSYEFLDALKEQGAKLYLASGTDHQFVVDEAEALGLTSYFQTHIYGAVDDYKKFSKKKIIEHIIKENNLSGAELLAVGDGYVEIENCKEVGGFALGVASDEAGRIEVDEWKRNRLIQAGADFIVPNFSEHSQLIDLLFGES
ncbi:MAG: HAD family hydrolase [Candidatus Hinthialibacter antarcticus]|nr:HAD family hydrolase [Candidatus Hinthialibacter antarcticus]